MKKNSKPEDDVDKKKTSIFGFLKRKSTEPDVPIYKLVIFLNTDLR